MSGELLFEEQKFTQKWVTAILVLVLLVTVAVAIAALVTKEGGRLLAVSSVLFGALFFVAFRMLALQVEIREDLIRFRFLPFQRRWKQLEREKIKQIAVINYDPMGDYGGWGVRIGKKGWAYIVKGNEGISIDVADGKNVLLGTSRPEDIKSCLKKFKYPLTGEPGGSP